MYTPVRIFGVELPLSVGKRQYLLLEEHPVSLSRKQAAAKAGQRLQALEKELLIGAVMLEKQEKVSLKEGMYQLQADYLVEELISVQSEIFINDETE